MADPIFAHPRLAQVYDAFDGPRVDLDLYLDLAMALGARTVVDIGCGTGVLARRLAANGLDVVAVDPAAASLDVASARDLTGAVTWVLGEAADAPEVDADLALMTGNVVQVFLTDEDWAAVLRSVRRSVRLGGHLLFPDGEEITSVSTLRFRSQEEVTTSLEANGFAIVNVLDAPDRPG